jgi:hypothetical protein
MPEYDQYSPMPNKWLRKGTSAYNNERELYEVLQMETYNNKGVQMYYYPVSISADKLFQEDNLRVAQRRFDFMSYYELPAEIRQTGIMGITYTETFPIYTSIMHFNNVSRRDVSGTYRPETYTFPVIPKIGDVVYAKYNQTLYVITNVKTEIDMFLQGKHTYTFILEMFKDKNYLFSEEVANIPNDPFYNVGRGTTSADIFDIRNAVNIEKQNILYTPSNTECAPKDPFNDWFNN